LLHSLRRRRRAPQGLAAFEAKTDSAQKNVIPQRFGQVLESAGLHSSDGCLHIGLSRDEDDRHVSAVRDTLLQIETIEIRQSDIQY
jgi:hypothetical protein